MADMPNCQYRYYILILLPSPYASRVSHMRIFLVLPIVSSHLLLYLSTNKRVCLLMTAVSKDSKMDRLFGEAELCSLGGYLGECFTSLVEYVFAS